MLPPIRAGYSPIASQRSRERAQADELESLRRQILSLNAELRRLQDVASVIDDLDVMTQSQLINLRHKQQEKLIFALKRQLSSVSSSTSDESSAKNELVEALKRDNNVLELRSRAAVDTVAAMVPVFASSAPTEVFDAFLSSLNDQQRDLIATVLRRNERGPTPSVRLLLQHWAKSLERMLLWCVRDAFPAQRRADLRLLLMTAVHMFPRVHPHQLQTLTSLIEISLNKLSISGFPTADAIDSLQVWLSEVIVSAIEVLVDGSDSRLVCCQQLLYHLCIVAQECGVFHQKVQRRLFLSSSSILLSERRSILLGLFVSICSFDTVQLSVNHLQLMQQFATLFPHASQLADLVTTSADFPSHSLDWPSYLECIIELAAKLRLDRSKD